MRIELAEILQDLLKEKGMTINALAVQAGIPQPTAYRLVKGSVKTPKFETLEKIAKVFGQTPSQLVSVLGDASPAMRTVPLISWDELDSFKAMVLARDSRLESYKRYGAPEAMSEFSCCVKMIGTAYGPVFNDGDILFIDCDFPATEGEVSVHLLNGKIDLRRVVCTPSEVLYEKLSPDAPGDRFLTALAGLNFIGHVVGRYSSIRISEFD